MKFIPLTKGNSAMVDDDDFEWLSKFRWFCNNGGYAVRMSSQLDGRRKPILMHRVIAKTPDGMQTDHIDGNKLNNARVNLRICTSSQNHHNARKHRDNKSGYKGVHWHKRSRKWLAQIKHGSRVIYLGLFSTALEAAHAYDNEACKYFGEFARPNF